MALSRKIRVLVVDDSLVFRETLSKGISSDSNIEVIATASDPYEARDKILKYNPDVMTCDVEMPKMNGIEFIRRLLPQYTIPVIVVSAVNDAVFDAIKAGAVDFVVKPNLHSNKGLDTFLADLITKIKTASIANLAGLKAKTSTENIKQVQTTSSPINRNIIAIGASTGGTEALYSLIKALPPNMPGIVIVQHIPPVFSAMFAKRLDSATSLHVKEAETGDLLTSGKVIIAPGDKHIKVKKLGDQYRVDCFSGEKVNGHCPSVDVLFDSVAKEGGKAAIGVILTGMGHDGAKGLLAMRKNGAITIGQDSKSSVVYGMPKVAFEIGAVEKQAPLENIPGIICSSVYR